jgi:hypothetical protein
MTAHGKWRYVQERAFNVWWAKFRRENPGNLLTMIDIDHAKYERGTKRFIAATADQEELARLVAREAWFQARHPSQED